ncbi:unnamed protein product, partial [Ilex paraguariensis]
KLYLKERKGLGSLGVEDLLHSQMPCDFLKMFEPLDSLQLLKNSAYRWIFALSLRRQLPGSFQKAEPSIGLTGSFQLAGTSLGLFPSVLLGHVVFYGLFLGLY